MWNNSSLKSLVSTLQKPKINLPLHWYPVHLLLSELFLQQQELYNLQVYLSPLFFCVFLPFWPFYFWSLLLTKYNNKCSICTKWLRLPALKTVYRVVGGGLVKVRVKHCGLERSIWVRWDDFCIPQILNFAVLPFGSEDVMGRPAAAP